MRRKQDRIYYFGIVITFLSLLDTFSKNQSIPIILFAVGLAMVIMSYER